MKTLVTVEQFKYTGKWYSSFTFETELQCFEIPKIKLEVQSKKEFITKMDYTIEVEALDNSGAWNKYLFCSDANK